MIKINLVKTGRWFIYKQMGQIIWESIVTCLLQFVSQLLLILYHSCLQSLAASW